MNRWSLGKSVTWDINLSHIHKYQCSDWFIHFTKSHQDVESKLAGRVKGKQNLQEWYDYQQSPGRQPKDKGEASKEVEWEVPRVRLWYKKTFQDVFFRSLFNALLADHLMASTFVSHPVTSRHTTLLRGLPASGFCRKHIMKWGGGHWRHLCKLLLPVFPFLLQAPTWFLTILIQPTTCVYQCVSAPTHLPRRLWKDGTATPMARPEITDWNAKLNVHGMH